MVSFLAFYSGNLSSNSAGNLNFLNEKVKINKEETEVGPSLKKQPSADKTHHQEKFLTGDNNPKLLVRIIIKVAFNFKKLVAISKL